jgi:diguanylate cyclase (GGDEF)-like protein
MRILIADDDAVSRRVLEATLQRLGHDVTVTENGFDAAEALLRPGAPRLAILDWVMPEMDGLAVCRAIRRLSPHYIYVILLTARRRHEDMLAGLEAEADDFLTKPVDLVELQARLRSGDRVLTLQERLLATQDALRHEASHDRLTAVWNRGRILDHLESELTRAAHLGLPLTVAIADLDHFKRINDTYGHSAGDVVLRGAAGRLLSVLRTGDALGRYGGEEFLLVLPGCDAPGARLIAERARAAFGPPFVLDDGTRLSGSVSLGFACAADGYAAAPLIQAADRALYRAKSEGRNRVEAGAVA